MIQSARHIWMIARLVLREAWRRRLLWIAAGLGLAFLTLYAVGFAVIYHNEVVAGGQNPSDPAVRGAVGTLVIMGLYVVNFLVVMTTVLTTVGAISQEIDSNTIHTIAAKPLRRQEIFLGKWVGHALMVVAYILVMTASIFAIAYVIAGHVAPNVAGGVSLIILEGLVVLSVSLLGSTLLSTLANGVMVFMLYGIALIGAFVEQLGGFLESRAAVDIGIVTSLILPTEALWRRAAYTLQSPLVRVFASATPFGSTSIPSPVFVVYAAIYVVVIITVATRTFVRRDF